MTVCDSLGRLLSIEEMKDSHVAVHTCLSKRRDLCRNKKNNEYI